MKKSTCFSLLFLLSIVVVSCAFPFKLYREAFMPKIIKEKYRPFERNIRQCYEGFYTKTLNNTSIFLRKMGIL